MKTTQIAFLILTFLSFFVSAQAQEAESLSPRDRAIKISSWMKKNLNLDESQEPGMQEINLKYAIKLEELKNSSASKNRKLKTLQKESAAKDNELKALFTEEQFETYLAKKEELTQLVKEEIYKRKSM